MTALEPTLDGAVSFPAFERPGAAKRPRWHLALELWAASIIIAAAAQVLFKVSLYQWDLIVYWWGGRAYLAGHSPFGPIPQMPAYLHYVYPPITAAVFAPLGYLSLSAAKLVWIGAKAVAFWFTVRLWQRTMNVRPTIVPPIFFFTFAFGSAALVDFTAGNIAIFQQLALWLAFAALLARKPWVFAVIVALLAQFKLTPIFFLGALLVIDERPRWKPFFGGAAVFVGMLLANVVMYPGMVREFLANVSSLNERGWADPAMLGVMQDFVEQVRALGIPIPVATAYALHAAAALAVLFYTVRWWRARRADGSVDRVEIVLVTIVVYALVMPRMKDYSYVALLPVAWYVLARPRLRAGPLVVLAAFVPRPLPELRLHLPLLDQAYVYAPLFGALAVWAELIHAPAEAADEPTSGYSWCSPSSIAT